METNAQITCDGGGPLGRRRCMYAPKLRRTSVRDLHIPVWASFREMQNQLKLLPAVM